MKCLCRLVVMAGAGLAGFSAFVPLASADVVAIPRAALPADVQQKLAKLDSLTSDPKTSRSSRSWLIAKRVPTDETEATIKRDIATAILGKGYDMWTGARLFETCIQPTAQTVIPIPAIPGYWNPHNAYKIQSIEGLKEHFSNRSSDLSIGIVYQGFSLGASSDRYSGEHYQNTNRYIDIHLRYVGDEFFLAGGKPTPTASNAIKSNPGDLTNFAKVCGQRFVSRVGFGVALDGEVKFDITVNTNTSNNQSGIDIGIKKILSFGATSSDGYSDTTKLSKVSAEITGGGGEEPKPDELLEYARKFGSVQKPEDSRHDVFIETTAYSEVDSSSFRRFDDAMNIALGTVTQYTYDRVQTVQKMSELNNAAKNTGFITYVPANGETLAAATAAGVTYLNDLGEMFKTCRAALTPQAIDDCKLKGALLASKRPVIGTTTLSNQAAPP